MAEQSLTVREAPTGSQPPSSASRAGAEGGGFGIYKWGRGYWVRVLTAIAVGMLFLAGALWAWQQSSTISLPARAWTIAVGLPAGSPAVTPGTPVTLVNVIDGKDVTVGSGAVESLTVAPDGSRANIVVTNVTTQDGANVRDAKRLDVGEGSSAVRGRVMPESNAVAKIPVFNPVYLHASISGAILLTGLIAIYTYVGRKPSSVDFLIATDEEMRKVNWSTRKTIVDSTGVVIAATFLIAAFIFFWDLVLKKLLLDWIVAF